MGARDLVERIIYTLLEHIGALHLVASRDVRTLHLNGVRVTVTVHIEPVEGIAWNDSSSRLSLRTGQPNQGKNTEA
jgi:hypothetical protein